MRLCVAVIILVMSFSCIKCEVKLKLRLMPDFVCLIFKPRSFYSKAFADLAALPQTVWLSESLLVSLALSWLASSQRLIQNFELLLTIFDRLAICTFPNYF